MRVVVLGLVLALGSFVTRDARACGGLFCNGPTPVPIVQAGERVLFARHDGLVTMHIEVVYQGEPTKFGWILPVPDPPKDSDGQPLPLERAVSISPQGMFATLQRLTDPVFTVAVTRVGQSCIAPDATVATYMTAEADSASSAETSGSNPPVVVLEEAKVGPYDAQLIHAEDSNALYDWLADNGYQQDETARPMLEHYVRMGYDFIGIRLQNGKSTDALRPLALVLGEDAPCVPLRLTSIAATADMPILVWVLGPGRALPKNFIHARLNPMAFAYPGGGGYQSLVSQAIDTASGRAWVTELAADASNYASAVPPAPWTESALAALAEGPLLHLEGRETDPDVLAILREEIPLPSSLRGYPYGNCRYCDGCSTDGCPDSNDEHVTNDGELYGFLDYWLAQPNQSGLVFDRARLVERFRDEVVKPREALLRLFTETSTLTRFFTTIDPSEMTRDPIFAFNPELPDVSNVHTANVTIDSRSCDHIVMHVTYEDGRSATLPCSGFCSGAIPSISNQDALLALEVVDESGEPVVFARSQVAEVDRIMDGATVGLPTLPPSFTPETPEPPLDPPTPPSVGESHNDGCASSGASSALALLAVLALAHENRTRRLRPLTRRSKHPAGVSRSPEV